MWMSSVLHLIARYFLIFVFFFCSVVFTFGLAIAIMLLLTVYTLCFRLGRPLPFASFPLSHKVYSHIPQSADMYTPQSADMPMI